MVVVTLLSKRGDRDWCVMSGSSTSRRRNSSEAPFCKRGNSRKCATALREATQPAVCKQNGVSRKTRAYLRGGPHQVLHGCFVIDLILALLAALRVFLREYVAYHHDDRIHDALDKDTPNRRAREPRPSAARSGDLDATIGWPSSPLRLAQRSLTGRV